MDFEQTVIQSLARQEALLKMLVLKMDSCASAACPDPNAWKGTIEALRQEVGTTASGLGKQSQAVNDDAAYCMTHQQVLDKLNFSKTTINRRRIDGTIRTKTVSGRFLYHKEDVERLKYRYMR